MEHLSSLGRWLRASWELVLLCGGFMAFYLWIASSSGSPFELGSDQQDYYNLLADAFRAGQLHLQVEPSAQLLALDDPYDPAQNAALRLHDASLYDGHYFLQWGPAPALLLFLPARLLLPGDLPATLAAAGLAFAGLACSAALLRFLVRRHAPAAPRWIVAAGVLALGTSGAVPFVLRRVAIYELSILSAYACLMAGLYLIATATSGELSARRIAAGSTFVGLAVACRASLVLPALALVALAWWVVRRGSLSSARAAAVILGPAAAIGVLLAAYNAARFGNPLEFGNSYQLAGVDVRELPANRPANLLPGLFYYLLARAHMTLDFPFFHLPPPPAFPAKLPDGYQVEVTGGVLANAPLVALGAVGLILLQGAPRTVVGLLLGGGVAFAAFLSFTLPGATERYIVDFAALLMLAGALAWPCLYVRARRRAARWLIALGGAALVAWGALVGVAISFTGYYDGLLTARPAQYRAVEDAASVLPTTIAKLRDRLFLVEASSPDGVSDADPGPGFERVAMKVGQRGAMLEIVAPRAMRAVVAAEVVSAAGSPPARLTVRANGVVKTLPARRRRERIPVELRSGLNRVELSAPALVDVLDVALSEPAARR